MPSVLVLNFALGAAVVPAVVGLLAHSIRVDRAAGRAGA